MSVCVCVYAQVSLETRGCLLPLELVPGSYEPYEGPLQEQ